MELCLNNINWIDEINYYTERLNQIKRDGFYNYGRIEERHIDPEKRNFYYVCTLASLIKDFYELIPVHLMAKVLKRDEEQIQNAKDILLDYHYQVCRKLAYGVDNGIYTIPIKNGEQMLKLFIENLDSDILTMCEDRGEADNFWSKIDCEAQPIFLAHTLFYTFNTIILFDVPLELYEKMLKMPSDEVHDKIHEPIVDVIFEILNKLGDMIDGYAQEIGLV